MSLKPFLHRIHVLLLLTILSCDPGEIPIPSVERGNAHTTRLDMGVTYDYQMYFDLETNTVVADNFKVDWDIGLSCATEEWKVVLNSSRGGSVAYSPLLNFTSAVSLNSLSWRYDAPSGDYDSTALGSMLDSNGFYIINLGYSSTGSELGYKKFKVDTLKSDTYSVRMASLNGSSDTTIIIQKDPLRNIVCISLKEASQLSIEPLKKDWDLHFTQYIHLFKDDNIITPYLVTGVLSNRHNVEVALIDSIEFIDIDTEHALSSIYERSLNSIGYDWKYYDFNDGYIVDSKKVYIIRDTDQKVYKLHFIDFYNVNGEKGSPTFEFQEI